MPLIISPRDGNDIEGLDLSYTTINDGGLEHLKGCANFVKAHPVPPSVQKGGLGHGAEGFVRGLDRDVRAAGQGGGREVGVKSEMGPVGLVNEEGDAVVVARSRRLGDVGAQTKVVWGDHQDA